MILCRLLKEQAPECLGDGEHFFRVWKEEDKRFAAGYNAARADAEGRSLNEGILKTKFEIFMQKYRELLEKWFDYQRRILNIYN